MYCNYPLFCLVLLTTKLIRENLYLQCTWITVTVPKLMQKHGHFHIADLKASDVIILRCSISDIWSVKY